MITEESNEQTKELVLVGLDITNILNLKKQTNEIKHKSKRKNRDQVTFIELEYFNVTLLQLKKEFLNNLQKVKEF